MSASRGLSGLDPSAETRPNTDPRRLPIIFPDRATATFPCQVRAMKAGAGRVFFTKAVFASRTCSTPFATRSIVIAWHARERLELAEASSPV